jgi:hypothetical protein
VAETDSLIAIAIEILQTRIATFCGFLDYSNFSSVFPPKMTHCFILHHTDKKYVHVYFLHSVPVGEYKISVFALMYAIKLSPYSA